MNDFCEKNGINPDQDRKQLEMCWIVTDDPIEMNLPEGYTMENYSGEQDKASWCECCREGMLIDLGNAGVADKWRDIALCYRSLRHNADGTFGKYYPGIAPDDLFKELGIEPDWDKMRYYILLDEPF